MPLLSEVLREFPYTKDWSHSSSLYFFSPEVWASPFLGHSQITCKALRMKNFFPLAFPMSHFLNLFLLIPVLTPQPPCPPPTHFELPCFLFALSFAFSSRLPQTCNTHRDGPHALHWLSVLSSGLHLQRTLSLASISHQRSAGPKSSSCGFYPSQLGLRVQQEEYPSQTLEHHDLRTTFLVTPSSNNSHRSPGQNTTWWFCPVKLPPVANVCLMLIELSISNTIPPEPPDCKTLRNQREKL